MTYHAKPPLHARRLAWRWTWAFWWPWRRQQEPLWVRCLRVQMHDATNKGALR